MHTIPRDTDAEVWQRRRAALERLGPEGRVRVAIELSDAVRSIHLAGLRARNPGWTERQAVRHFLATALGLAFSDLP